MIDYEKLADEVLEKQYAAPASYGGRTQREKLRALSEEFRSERPKLEKQEFPVEDSQDAS